MLREHTDFVNCLIQLKDSRIISCSLNNTIKVWFLTISKSKSILTLTEHNRPVICLI